jgi:uncharacterized protein YecT (DUF1311 family)
MKLWLTTTAICVLFVGGSFAEQVEPEEDKCCCSTFETGQCLITVHKKVDAELNDVYQQALKKWKEPEHTGNLRKAQRAWVSYRDANCDAEYATYGRGTMGPNMYAMCRIKLTRQRTEEIKRIYLPAH